MRIEGCSLRITLVALVAWKTLPNCAVKNISHPTTYKKYFQLTVWLLGAYLPSGSVIKPRRIYRPFFRYSKPFFWALEIFFWTLKRFWTSKKNANASEEIILESDVLGSEEECFVVASYIGSVAG